MSLGKVGFNACDVGGGTTVTHGVKKILGKKGKKKNVGVRRGRWGGGKTAGLAKKGISVAAGGALVGRRTTRAARVGDCA